MSWDTTDLSFKVLLNKQVTSDTKKHYEEFGADTINAHVDDLWVSSIPYNDPSSGINQGSVEQRTQFLLTWDNTVPNNQCYYAADGTRLKDWISDKYGSNYAITLFQNDGTKIFTTDVSQWIFNYQTGILTFNGSTAGFSKPFKITGYRYIGKKGYTGIMGVTGPQSGSTGVQGLQGVTGLVGVTGLAGDTGPQGVTGLIGDTGPQGITGLIGDTGPQGVTGLIGETGIQGIQGVTGLIGETGPQGVTGLIGDTGPQGLTGLIGETGIQGIQGVTGLIGETGPQGVTGLIGETGPQGVTGLIGETGPQGVTGLIGETGIQGIQGDTGPQGVTGLQGPVGETGLQGADGGNAGRVYYLDPSMSSDIPSYYSALLYPSSSPETTLTVSLPDSSAVLIGTFATDSTGIGVEQIPPGTAFRHVHANLSDNDSTARFRFDVYIRNGSDETLIRSGYSQNIQGTSASQYIWNYSDGNGYPTSIYSRVVFRLYAERLSGTDPVDMTTYYDGVARASFVQTTISAGAVGPQGFTGLQGITGFIGSTGLEGPSGATGPQGETGPQGITGLIGETGIQGIQGDTGPQGVTGLIGETGPQGVTGLIGETGPQGVTGLIGETGPQGVTGLIGETGPQGVTGLIGETGPQGVTGLIGDTGPQGVTGLIGETGPQGVTGLIGETGPQGVTGLIGDTGPQGVTGLIGDTGPQGVTGLIGETGIQGIQGVEGLTGLVGLTGVQGITGGVGIYFANQLPLGVPTDGSYTDGMFPWDASTTMTADAIDDLNELMLAIAPQPPSALSGSLTLTGPTKYTAILPSNLVVAWYQDGSNAGNTVYDYVITNTYALASGNPSTSFKVGSTFGGDVGTVYHVLNGSNGSSRDVTQGVGITGNIQITDVTTYNSIWRKANATINYTQSTEGYSRHAMRYQTTSVNQISNDTKFWYDDVNGTPGFPSGATVVQNTLSSGRYLSGVQYYAVGDSFDTSCLMTNIGKKGIRPTNPITYSMTGLNTVNVAINGSTFDWDGTYNLSATNSLNASNSYSINARMTIVGTKPSGTTANQQTASENRLINTYPVNYSTNCNVYMFDEFYRWPLSTNFGVVPTNYSNPIGSWDSTALLSNGNGQLYNSTWYYPSINYTSGYLPIQSANYSAFSGDQTVVWACNIGNAHSSMTISFTGLGSYTNISAQGTGNLNVLIRLPGVTPSFAPTGWMDLGKSFGNGNGCRNDIGTSGTTVACTFGTSSSSDSTGVVFIQVVLKNGSAATVSRMVMSGT